MGLLTDFLKYKYPNTFGPVSSTQSKTTIIPPRAAIPAPTAPAFSIDFAPKPNTFADIPLPTGMVEDYYGVPQQNKPSVFNQIGNKALDLIPLWKRHKAAKKRR